MRLDDIRARVAKKHAQVPIGYDEHVDDDEDYLLSLLDAMRPVVDAAKQLAFHDVAQDTREGLPGCHELDVLMDALQALKEVERGEDK